jgi:hypothetical protein
MIELSTRKERLEPLILVTFFLGAGLLLASFLPFRFFGNTRLPGFVLLGISAAVLWPEAALVALGGSSIGQTEFILSPFKAPYSGLFFMAGSAMALGIAAWILARCGVFKFRRPQIDWPLLFILVMSTWILCYTAIDYIWVARSYILDYYLIPGVYSGLILWYLFFGQSSDVIRSGKSLLWAILLINVSGLVVNMLVSYGSLSPLLSPYSNFWTISETSQRLSFGGFNEIGIAVEFLAPPVVAAIALLFSSRVPVIVKTIIAGIAVYLGILIMATGTRQAVLGGGAAIMTMLILTDRKQVRRLVVVMIPVLVVAFLVLNALWQRFSVVGVQQIAGLLSPRQLLTTDETTLLRFQYARRDIEAFLQNPVFGQGLSFSGVHNSMGIPPSHNLLTSIAAEVGIIPLIVTIGFLLVTFRSIRRIMLVPKLPGEYRVVLQGLAGLFVFSLVTSMISGRMEGGFGFFGYGTALYFIANQLYGNNADEEKFHDANIL